MSTFRCSALALTGDLKSSRLTPYSGRLQYSAAHVRSGKKVGVRGIHKTLTLLSLFPQTCLSNNRQCALQQSRNQAGHRLLSSSSNHRVPSSQPQSLLLPHSPHLPGCTESACSLGRVRVGEASHGAAGVVLGDAMASWSQEARAQQRTFASSCCFTHGELGEVEPSLSQVHVCIHV